MSSTPSLPVVPASFFSMVLGIVGPGFAWRQATRACAPIRRNEIDELPAFGALREGDALRPNR
jgi:hypothetical protein